MFLFNAHAVPSKESEYFNEVVGAYVSIYIDYADLEGAQKLCKFYIENEGWKMESLEEEYFHINDESELEDDQKEFFEETLEYGYTMVFNCYESDEEE